MAAAAVTRIVEPVGMAGAVPATAVVGVGAVAGLGAVVFLLAGSLTLLVPGFSRYGEAGPVRRSPLCPASQSRPGPLTDRDQ
ncbi:hypothetical protein ABTZ59_35915 [Streptomyces sp. NPDC094034]|uniref:hypothetical protein n=1 Tax=Streptomyces sp. NPDC094034 TaxID=3155309 RepID=UPI003326A395